MPISEARIEVMTVTEEAERVAAVLEEGQGARGSEIIAAIKEVTAFATGPSNEEMVAAQVDEFGDLGEAASKRDGMVVDQHGLLVLARGGDLAVLVSKTLTQTVLKYVHGSRLKLQALGSLQNDVHTVRAKRPLLVEADGF